MIANAERHYNQDYFAYQMPIGEFGGWENLTKFQPYISATDEVLDFGCGGGYLLRNLKCARKVGVEINPSAQAIAKNNGVEVYSSLVELPDASVDVVVSNHALEHTTQPLEQLQEMRRVLKPGGRIVMVVPCESVFRPYRFDNPDHHLFSWSPMCLGNILCEAGFVKVTARAYHHRPVPKIGRQIAKLGGRGLYELSSKVYGLVNPSISQSMGIGIKP